MTILTVYIGEFTNPYTDPYTDPYLTPSMGPGGDYLKEGESGQATSRSGHDEQLYVGGALNL